MRQWMLNKLNNVVSWQCNYIVCYYVQLYYEEIKNCYENGFNDFYITNWQLTELRKLIF